MGSRLIGCPKSTQTTGFTRLADALVREAYWDTDNTTLVMEFALTDSMVERASDAPSDATSGARSPARGPSCARVAAIGCSRNPADLMFDNSRAKWHSPRGRLRSADRLRPPGDGPRKHRRRQADIWGRLQARSRPDPRQRLLRVSSVGKHGLNAACYWMAVPSSAYLVEFGAPAVCSSSRWCSRCIVITGRERPLARPGDGRLNDAPGG
jgi:hypothetical protein